MSAIDRLASSLGRRDEAPNIALARDIAATNDSDAVQDLVDHLASKNREIQSDCIKVLYEIGALKPVLIADHVAAFIGLLNSRNNRLVWGGMTALGTIVGVKAAEMVAYLDRILDATAQGSVITQDWGIRVLAQISAAGVDSEQRIMPFLMNFLKTCPPKDVPRHAESILIAIRPAEKHLFAEWLSARAPSLKPAQAKRLEKLLRKIDTL